jgi:hypothetical protein
MTEKSRVNSAVSTHSQRAVKVDNSEFEVENHQSDMLLIDPEEVGNVSTHSADKPKASGAKRAPTTAALTDEQRPKGGKIAQIPNDVDPSVGYLEQEAGMPVINNASADEDLYNEGDENVDAEFEDLEDLGTGDVGEIEAADDDTDEFDDLTADLDDMDAVGGPDVEVEDEPEVEAEAEEAPLAFEQDEPEGDAVALVDADSMADDDVEDVAFATMANVVHVLKANRIIASMGPSLARKVGMSDLYLSEQFQDVVSASMQAKGLRKGLVQSGFVLAKVKLAAASKATAKAVQAKVEAQVNQKMQALARKDQAMEQCLAIAAVGINRRFFKNTDNELKASLETEFQRMGVRGAGNVIRAMFAQHGVSYAKAILTLANKISAMPEDVRNQYAEALDLTNDEDFDVDAGLDEDDEVEDDDVEEIPTSVTAALVTPARRQTAALLKAGVKTTAAMSILSGDSSLV